MKEASQKLLDYIEKIGGERPVLDAAECLVLPLFLRDRYRLFRTSIFGRNCLLAIESGEWEIGPASEYSSQVEILARKLGHQVVLVLPQLPSHTRNRLVQSRVPFIVPGNQMFLPFLMLDLRERFATVKPAAGKALSPTAQLIVLHHLLKGSMEQMALKDIAERLDYSSMMVTKAKDELEVAGLCHVHRDGRSVVLQFRKQGLQLWERAESVLSSPVRRVHWVRREHPPESGAAAGLTALSKRTMIEDDRVPTWAVDARQFRERREAGDYQGCREPEDANTRIEVWRYNPRTLADEKGVDPLSLYLSLRHSPDERVQQQLETLIESIPW